MVRDPLGKIASESVHNPMPLQIPSEPEDRDVMMRDRILCCNAVLYVGAWKGCEREVGIARIIPHFALEAAKQNDFMPVDIEGLKVVRPASFPSNPKPIKLYHVRVG